MAGREQRIAIIGAGVVGSAIAYFLAARYGVRAHLIERDPTFAGASSALSASSIRQQFTCAVNIELSRRSWRFLTEEAPSVLAEQGVAAAFSVVERGYLYLANEAGRADLERNVATQQAHGVPVDRLERDALAVRWPWLRCDDLAAGAFGREGEGWFDGPALHAAFLRKARALGVHWRVGEVVGFLERGRVVEALALADGERLEVDQVVIAAGAWSARVLASLGISLPVVARKRDIFVLSTPARLDQVPLVIDPSGVWFRPEGRHYIAGAPPRPQAGAPCDPDEAPLSAIDHGLFDEVIWPALAHRVPAFEALRVETAWAGYYEMNTFDHNGLVGAWPGLANVHLACGFSGHGMQQAPAVGEAVAELLMGRDVPWIEPLSPTRLLQGRPLHEGNVI